MARPTKEGLDYFPLDVDMDQDDKVLIIISKFGFEGFGILVKLLMEIYKNGYYYHWTEKEQIIFSSRVSVDINSVKEIVDECVKWGLFDQQIYEEHHVLTSKGIQERFLLATSRRVNVDIKEELKLVSVDINSNSSEKKSSKSTQSKVKESKRKESKQKYRDFVYLSPTEYEKLVDKLGQSFADKMIEKLDDYIASKGAKYKSHYRTILMWVKRDQEKGQAPITKPKKKTESELKKERLDYLRGELSKGYEWFLDNAISDYWDVLKKEAEEIEQQLRAN